MRPLNPNLIGGLYALTGAILFSTKAVFVKMAYRHDVDAVSLLMLRMLFSVPFFIIIGLIYLSKKNVDRDILKVQWWRVVLLGLTGYYIASYLDLKGLTYIDASLERIILFIYPTVVVILSFVIYRIPIRAIQIWAILITYVGIAISFSGNMQVSMSEEIYTGSTYIFFSAIAYSLYLVGTGDLSKKIGTPLFNSLAMSAAAAGILIHNFIVHGFNVLSFTEPVYCYAILISIISTVIPSYLIVEGIRRIGASNSSIIGSVGPISTILLAIYLLDERLNLTQTLGSALVIFGVLLVMMKKEKR